MEFIYHFLSDHTISALGWTVVHSLWQGALIALVLAVIMPFLQQRSSQLRYEVALGALFLMLLSAVCTFIVMIGHTPVVEEQFIAFNYSDVAVIHQDISGWQYGLLQITDYFETHLPIIVLTWLLGMLFFLLRMLGGFAYVQHLRFNRNQLLEVRWQKLMHQLKWRLQLKRPVRLVESALVKVPMVIGHFKPMILMPLGAVNQLSSDEVEAILAHELSHISRNDYLMNFFVSFTEVLFYYHPGVWWIAANVRNERENCCDDIAIKLCGNSLTYAKALVSLQEFHHTIPSFAMPFSGKKNHLLNRVKRILNQPQNRSNVMEKLMATGMMLVLLIFLGASSSPDLESPEIELIDPNTEFAVDQFTGEVVPGSVTMALRIDKKRPHIYEVLLDTIPGNSRKRIYRRTEGDRSIEVIMSGDKIESLTIDGEKIPQSELENNEALVEDVLREMESATPPAPPAPPTPPSPAVVPTPPAPPAPPAPPSPGTFKWNEDGKLSRTSTRTITTERDENGVTRIFISGDSQGEPMEIIVEEGDEVIVIDGNEMMEGDSIIIIEETDFDGLGFGNFFTTEGENYRFNFRTQDLSDQWVDVDDVIIGSVNDAERALAIESEALAKLRDQIWVTTAENAAAVEEMRERERAIAKTYRAQIKSMVEKEQDLREEQMAKQREEMERSREMVAKIQREQRIRQAEEMAQHRLNVKRAMERQRQRQKQNNDDKLFQTFRETLVKDGIIKEGKAYRFELTDTKLKVNGKKQPKEIHQKYLELYQSVTGQAFGKGKINIRQDGEHSSTSISRYSN